MISTHSTTLDHGAATRDHQAPARVPLATWLKYSAAFALLWTLLTQAQTSAWLIGVVIVPLATWCALKLFPTHDLQASSAAPGFTATLRFIPFFLIQSFKGGWESALLAIHPRRRVKPGFIRYQTMLPQGRPRLFFINTISLLPGTVSAKCEDDLLTIHALDSSADNCQALAQCEAKIAQLFGLNKVALSNAEQTQGVKS